MKTTYNVTLIGLDIEQLGDLLHAVNQLNNTYGKEKLPDVEVLVDAAPQMVRRQMPREEALKAIALLQEAGAKVETR